MKRQHNKVPRFLGLHAELPRSLHIILAALPFVLLLLVYFTAAEIRHSSNPQDKLLPTLGKLTSAANKVALQPDKRSGKRLLWSDTASSLKRLGLGVGISALAGFILGLNMGLLPGLRGLSLTFITFIANIPPLAILPILFITFGVDELGKVMLIIIGTFPLITRDIYLETKKIPRATLVKALTLGASQFGVIYRVIMPQVLPRLIETVRLSSGRPGSFSSPPRPLPPRTVWATGFFWFAVICQWMSLLSMSCGLQCLPMEPISSCASW